MITQFLKLISTFYLEPFGINWIIIQKPDSLNCMAFDPLLYAVVTHHWPVLILLSIPICSSIPIFPSILIFSSVLIIQPVPIFPLISIFSSIPIYEKLFYVNIMGVANLKCFRITNYQLIITINLMVTQTYNIQTVRIRSPIYLNSIV